MNPETVQAVAQSAIAIILLVWLLAGRFRP